MDVDLPAIIAGIEQEVHAADTRKIYIQQFETRLGFMTAAATDSGLCLLQYSDSDRLEVQLMHVSKAIGAVPSIEANCHLTEIETQLADWYNTERSELSVAYNTYGTPFQELVWEKLAEISFGQTQTFGEVAYSVDRPGAIRAVAAAIGANALAILVPCHRIISAGGGIKGYSGGIDRKKWLIDFEKNNS